MVAHKTADDNGSGRQAGPTVPFLRAERRTSYLSGGVSCYSGKYTREEMVAKISSTGGMYDYLGTKDAGVGGSRMGLGDDGKADL